MTMTKPHPDAVWIRLRGAEGWGCHCMAVTLPKVEDEMLALGLIHTCLDVYQWAYNRGKVDASAGTHDLGGVIDVGQYSLPQRKVFAKWGWMPFPRTKAFGWSGGAHCHAAVVGCPHQVEYVRWQVRSGLAGGDGLGPMTSLRGKKWWGFEKPTHTWQQRMTINEGAARAAIQRANVKAQSVLPTLPPISLSVTMRAITGTERGKPSGNVTLLQKALVAEGLLRPDQVTRIWDQPTGSGYDAFLKREGITRGPEGRPTLEGFAALMGAHGFKAVL